MNAFESEPFFLTYPYTWAAEAWEPPKKFQ